MLKPVIVGNELMSPRTWLLIAALTFTFAGPAVAHPHVWVVVKSKVIFDNAGKVAGIRHSWNFDDMYSAFVTAGVGENGKVPTSSDLQPVAQTNMDSLKDFGYFTVSKIGGKTAEFAPPEDYSMSYNPADQTATLHFTIRFAKPLPSKTFVFRIYDPEYFVAFSFDRGTNAVELTNAPKGCSLSVIKPNALGADESKQLSESFFSGLSPGADFGIKLADHAIVACP